MAGGTANHGLISGNVLVALKTALRARGCRVFPSDMRIKSPSGLYTYADVSVVCGEPQHEGSKHDVLLNPLLVVEVLSDSTESYDRGRKSVHYRQIPSLRGYLLVSQNESRLELLSREAEGPWVLTEAATGDLYLPAVGCSLNVEDVYDQVELPPADAAVQSAENGTAGPESIAR
jgi:Uma2 family endonuclease